MKKILLAIINAFFSLFPLDEKKILFISTGYRVNDNPYAVYRYIKEQKLDYRTVYLVGKDADVEKLDPRDVVYVRSLKGLYHMATYKYRITCQSYGSVIRKRKGQRYIQLWHAISSVKKMGLDVENPNGLTQLPHTVDWDYYVSSSETDVAILKSSSGYTCQTKILGSARTDAIYEARDVESIKEALHIPKGRKVLLYAPTFREADLKKDTVEIDFLPSLDPSYVLLVRLHPWVAEKIDPSLFDARTINVCTYPDLNDLFAVADVLLTDYSSIFYDFSLLHKLSVFYPYDYEDYVRERGGFYPDYQNGLPGPVAYSVEELSGILKDPSGALERYAAKIEETNRIYNPFNDGTVCRRIVSELQNGGFDR